MPESETVPQCKEFEHSWQAVGTPHGAVKSDTAWHCLVCGARLWHTPAQSVNEKVVEVDQALGYDYSC